MATPKIDREEFVGPFASWTNVKTECGAVGDGKADDTGALMKGFTQAMGHGHVIYLPAGTYRLTKSLDLTATGNFHLIGEDPATTIIKWDGAESDEQAMLSLNGVYYCKFSRLTWDGEGKHVTAVYHRWGADQGGVGTGHEHSDEIFKDLDFGIRAGKPGKHLMDAETTVLRCRFLRNTVAGVRIQSFNALDWFIWDSEFDDCAIGITNDPGAGHFHAYRNIFRRSTVADIVVRNASYFGIQGNLSEHSQRFFEGRDVWGWANPIVLQGNTILDTVNPVAISINQVGPVMLLDNVVRSRPEVKTGPVMLLESANDGSYLIVGNTCTVPAPIRVKARAIVAENLVVAAKSVAVPKIPGAIVPPHVSRQVLEVPAGATAEVLQALITRTIKYAGHRPIIHFATSVNIDKTVTVPAGLDVQFVGDVGFEHLRLNWTGPVDGVMFKLEGPVRATFRDLSLNGSGRERGNALGILVTHADQPAARVFGDGLSIDGNGTGLLVNGLEQADISLRTFYHQGNLQSVRVIGGARAAAGLPTPARTCLFGGASSNNTFAYAVENGGRLLVTDTWYEGAPPTFTKLSGFGTFSMVNGNIASGRPAPNAAPADPLFAGVALENFHGCATFLGTGFGTHMVITDNKDGAGTNALLLGVHLQGNTDELFPQPPAKAKVAVLMAARYDHQPNQPPCCLVPNAGISDTAWVLQMLTQIRTDRPRLLTTRPKHITDLRFYRTQIAGFATGLQIEAK